MELQSTKNKLNKNTHDVKQILLTKLNSFLNSPIEKKMAYGSFVGGISLITMPYIRNFINLKLETKNVAISLNKGEGATDSLYLIIGILLLILSLYLLRKAPKLTKYITGAPHWKNYSLPIAFFH